MLRAYWTPDYGDASVVAAMLCAHGVRAFVFDAGMAQVNWFQSLAIGGYRVMVPAAQGAEARELVDGYRDGTRALPDADTPACPTCAHAAVVVDPRPRRFVFGLLIVSQFAPVGLMASYLPAWSSAFALALAPYACARLLGSRHRCSDCGGAFGLARLPFAASAQAVERGEAASLEGST